MATSSDWQTTYDAARRALGVEVPAPTGSAIKPVTSGPKSELLRAALDYAKRGWHVVPLHNPTARGCSCGHADCASPAKHPRTAHGLKDASHDPATIRQWWAQWKDANVGITTGPESGIMVLDVDGKKGEESLIELTQSEFILPDTYTVRTGGGGQHIYFVYPPVLDVRNSASKIAPGLDIRGAGGYVVASPSHHISGRRYEVNESAIPPTPCPDWLLSLIREPQGVPAVSTVASEHLIPKGKGDPEKLALAGTMFRKRQPLDVIMAAVIALDKKCEHQRGEDECRRKVTEWAQRYSQGKPLAEETSAILKPDLVRLFGANVDLHRSNETRPVLDGLSKLAEAHGCAILLLRHLSKMGSGKAIHRGLGSIDLTGAVRSEMLA